jgi:D-alanyl-D-alanine carboxypeptidase
MAANAWQYGFVMSYPKGATAVTCYASEPWHFRYVGRDLAAQVHASGSTLRAYLWANYTTTVVPPAPGSSGPPIMLGPTPDPTPTAGSPAAPGPTGAPPSATTQTAPPSIEPGVASASPLAVPDPIDPAVAAGALPPLVVIAAITFALIIGGAWLAARRRRPGAGR